MAKHFKDLVAQMSPERQAAIQKRVDGELAQVRILQPQYTEEYIRKQQQALALERGLTVAEAYAALDAGEYRGTIFASELSMLRFLLEGEGDGRG